ncbi:MAG TPA: AAA family ATPase [Gaiellaceae bacterium]
MAFREGTRIYVTGSCEGLNEMADALERHPEIQLVGRSQTVREGAGALAGGHLQAVLHATRASELPEDDLATIREYTRAPIVLLASGEASQLLDAALDADVADVLLLPQLPENVVFAIRKASHTARTGTGGADGRVLTVFSPKGGTGKTVMSTNLAAAVAKHGGKKTLLLDLDLQFGDAAIMLGIEPDKTIYDLVVAPGELDPEKLAGYTTRHASGVEVLPAPIRPEDAELVTEAKLSRLLEVAKESYEMIVVDTSPFFHGPMLATLDRTDELLLLCGLDVPTIKNVRLSLQTLELLSFPTERIRVVLNRANSNVGMKRGEVEAALEQSVRFEIPSDRAVPLAVNRGNPAVVSDPKADFSRAVREMAKALQPAAPAQSKKRWGRKQALAKAS